MMILDIDIARTPAPSAEGGISSEAGRGRLGLDE